MGCLEIFVNFVLVDIYGFLIIVFWQTTWYIQDKYLFPNNADLSCGLALAVGLFGLTAMGISQQSISKAFQKKYQVVCHICYRMLVLFWAMCCVCHWRGVWYLLDKYGAKISAAILLAASLFILSCLRSVRNILAPPFIIGIDTRKDFFLQPFICRKITGLDGLPLSLDVIFCVWLLGSLVVVFWRDMWTIYDKYLYPDDRVLSTIWCAVIFIIIQIIGEFFRFSAKKSTVFKRMPYLLNLLIHDIFFIVIGVGDVAAWRCYWKTTDFILEAIDKDYALFVFWAGSFVILVCCWSSTSIVIKGYIMDGEIGNWYDLPNNYLQNIRSSLKGKESPSQEAEKADTTSVFIIHL